MKTILLSCFFILTLCNSSSQAQVFCSSNDSLMWNELSKIQAQSDKQLWQSIALSFLNKPYVAHTLEVTADSALVVNLQGVDCTTYVEYVIAAFYSIKNNPNAGFDDFTRVIETIRYRNGKRENYASRLHYFSEWLFDNQKKGLISAVSSPMFQKKKINLTFMSSHRTAYEHLANDDFFNAIKEVEATFSPELMVLSKKDISKAEHLLNHGDLVALVTSIAGLDVTHTGFIYKKDGVSHVLHASTKSMKVEISGKPLSEYIRTNKVVEGITVYRFFK